MNHLLRYLVIALMLVAGVALVALCDDCFDAACGHPCCVGASSSRPMQRVVRRMLERLGAMISLVAFAPGFAAGEVCCNSRMPVGLATLGAVTALRI